MTTSLAHQQSLLLQALFGAADGVRASLHEGLASRGLQAYQANGLALAERALAAAYPVVTQLMGAESFASLAHYFWRRQPPQRGDMAQWGGGLADFLDAAPQLADEPFLGDVARVEWALHCVSTAQDAQPDPASLSLLSTGEPEQTTLSLSHGVKLFASAYPVVSLVNAHLLNHPSLAEAAALLQSGTAEHALVWRQGFKPRVRISSAAEHALVSALQNGLSLDKALTAAFDAAFENESRTSSGPSFVFNDWLAQSVHTGLVTGAQLLNQIKAKEDSP